MEFQKLMELLEENKAEYYEKLLREEQAQLEAIRQRKEAIASGKFALPNYFLWSHRGERPEVLQLRIENAERLLAIFEHLMGRVVVGTERKAVCETAKIDSDKLGKLEGMLKELESGKPGDAPSTNAGPFDPRYYFLQEYPMKLPSDLFRQVAARADRLIATMEKLLGRSLRGNENHAICEVAVLDPESVGSLQGMLDEILLKR